MSRSIKLVCIGKIKADAHTDLIQHYLKQIPSTVEIVELATGEKRDENMAIRKEIVKSPGTQWIALDARGDMASSEDLAQAMEPHARLGFIIGGADGLDSETLGMCHKKIAMGRMIWPHKLARVMLIEQVFRAHHIWTNHPYHRA